MLLSQMSSSTSTTVDSATAGPSSAKVAYSTRSFIELSATARSRAGSEVVEHVTGGCLPLFDNAVEQGKQDRVLRGEVEVEGGPGDARPSGQVVDGDLAQRPILQQSLRRGEDRHLPLVARGSRRAPASGCTRVDRGRACTHTRTLHVVELIDLLLASSTWCRYSHVDERFTG